MSWFRVDDMSAFHKKVMKAGNPAWGAFCRMGAHTAHYELDGLVPTEVATVIASSEEIDRLLSAGLLHLEDGGYRIHDFLHWNPSAADLAKLRKTRAKAGRAGGKSTAKRPANGAAHAPDVPPALDRASDPAIAPATEEHTRSSGIGIGSVSDLGSGSDLDGGSGGPAVSETRIRPSLAPTARLIDPEAKLTDEHRATAEMLGLRDVEGAWIGFVGHHRSRGTLSCDFAGEWQKWAVQARNIEQRDRAREASRGGPAKVPAHVQRAPEDGSRWKVGK